LSSDPQGRAEGRAGRGAARFLVTALCLQFVLVLPARSAPIDDLAWLAGCWASEGREAGSGEQWSAPAGGTMLGTSRTVRGGRTIEWEFLRIREAEDGVLEYVALPSRQAETVFRMTRLAEREVTFENPGHDFPQRIVYRREGLDRLVARIEGSAGGRDRVVEFPMRRASCAGAGPGPAG